MTEFDHYFLAGAAMGAAFGFVMGVCYSIWMDS